MLGSKRSLGSPIVHQPTRHECTAVSSMLDITYLTWETPVEKYELMSGVPISFWPAGLEGRLRAWSQRVYCRIGATKHGLCLKSIFRGGIRAALPPSASRFKRTERAW